MSVPLGGRKSAMMNTQSLPRVKPGSVSSLKQETFILMLGSQFFEFTGQYQPTVRKVFFHIALVGGVRMRRIKNAVALNDENVCRIEFPGPVDRG